MTQTKAARGRPKGSGINDQAKLLEIARVICSNPRMKPTTAIKAIGVTDPSAVRRLRDKFHEAQGHLAGQAGAPLPAKPTLNPPSVPASTVPASHRPAASAAPALRSVPLRVVEPAKQADPFPALELGHGLAALLPAKASRTDDLPIAAFFFGFGLNAATALFEQQMMIAQSMMKLPPVRDLIRSQIAVTEFMFSVARSSPGSRVVH